jgi:hypothetical protein
VTLRPASFVVIALLAVPGWGLNPLWIGADGGLARLERGRSATVLAGGFKTNVHVLLEYPAGTVWAGGNDGLPDHSIWGLAAGAGGAPWVGTDLAVAGKIASRDGAAASRSAA